mgnify:CR=1 FL=1
MLCSAPGVKVIITYLIPMAPGYNQIPEINVRLIMLPKVHRCLEKCATHLEDVDLKVAKNNFLSTTNYQYFTSARLFLMF